MRQRRFAVKLEYVILAVLVAAATVLGVIHFGRTLNEQTARAAGATTGRGNAADADREQGRSAAAGSRNERTQKPTMAASHRGDDPRAARNPRPGHDRDSTTEGRTAHAAAQGGVGTAPAPSARDATRAQAPAASGRWWLWVVALVGGGAAMVYACASRHGLRRER
jgi:hypothetical protein